MEEIKHKGRLYILKTEFNKKVKQITESFSNNDKELDFEPYSIKQKILLDKSLKKFLCEQNNVSESWAIKQENLCVLDPANVCMVVAKTSRAKQVLAKFYSEYANNKYPKLKYSESKMIDTMYSSDYLKKFMDFLSCLNTNQDTLGLHLLFKKDYPLTIYNDDWECILAPRVED